MTIPMAPKLFSSIFFKLMVVILLAGLGINVAIIFIFGAFRHHIASNYHPHLNRYVDYLLKDIGDPPDPIRARQIAAETDMIISYEGKDQTWTTAAAPMAVPINRFRIRHRGQHLEAGSYRGTYMVRVKQGDGRLTLLLTHQPDAEKKIRLLGIGLLIFITMLMVSAYIAIRWVLKPLRWLKQGVDQVAQGELTHRVPIKRADELRDLSVSFNTMTERLQHLIQSKEHLLLDVSHELRTPITRMRVALAMMPDSPDRASIEEDLEEMEKKITQLLETARSVNIKASLNYTTVDISDLIRKTAKPFQTGQPDIHIVTMPGVQIRLDAEKIGQALKNIIENSQKYSPDDARPIQVSMEIEPQQVVVAIQDHGIGIGDQDLDFIFEPFYRADKARSPQLEGYGLGLSLAKNIIEAHGGEIEVQSEVGRGTLVRIHLPLDHPLS